MPYIHVTYWKRTERRRSLSSMICYVPTSSKTVPPVDLTLQLVCGCQEIGSLNNNNVIAYTYHKNRKRIPMRIRTISQYTPCRHVSHMHAHHDTALLYIYIYTQRSNAIVVVVKAMQFISPADDEIRDKERVVTH